MSTRYNKDQPESLVQTETHAQALARLRRASVRVTAARINVLAALLSAPRAFSHQEMQQTLVEMEMVAADQGAEDRGTMDRVAMDRVTLYRALDCLTSAGLAHKIAGDDRIFRYSATAEEPEASRHAGGTSQKRVTHRQPVHFKCTRCARIFCLEDFRPAGALSDVMAALGPARKADTLTEMESAVQHRLGPGFQSHDIELSIKGWCMDCIN